MEVVFRMNYFNYQPKVPMGRVWGLFTELSEMSEDECLGKTKFNCQYAHTLEIIHAAVEGSLSNKAYEDFNLKAYEIKCNQTDEIEKKAQVDKCLFIVDTSGLQHDEMPRIGYGDIAETKIKPVDNVYDDINALNAFESNLNELLNIRKDYIVLHGIDLVSVIIGSLKGIPETLEVLSGIVKNNPKIKDLVASLCEDCKDGNLLNRLTAVV